MSFFNGRQLSARPLPGTTANDLKDVEVSDPPSDSISSLAFSAGDLLAVGSWNNEVRVYEVNSQSGTTQGKALYRHQAPVLSVCWDRKDGNRVISGGVDNVAQMYDLVSGQSIQFAQHDAPVKSVRCLDTPQGQILATGSWDKTLKYWDLRSSAPVATVQLPERCFTMDAVYPLLVVGTAGRHIQAFNLTNPTVPYRDHMSPLKWQTRVITCFPSAEGYAVGSIEGRVAMHYVDEAKLQHNYSFRCHRKDDPNEKNKSLVYAINDINFHPVLKSAFSTAGSDGTLHYWDRDARLRLKAFEASPAPVLATTFNHSGTIFAYAVSYDWSKGHIGMTPGQPNKIMLHRCKEEELKRSKK